MEGVAENFRDNVDFVFRLARNEQKSHAIHEDIER